jgi:hypothetical protein
MTTCRGIYSVANVGVRRQKVPPGDIADKFRLKSASATLARNDLKEMAKVDDVEHFPETLTKTCLSCL